MSAILRNTLKLDEGWCNRKWDQVPLLTNVFTGIPPAIIHHNAHRAGQAEREHVSHTAQHRRKPWRDWFQRLEFPPIEEEFKAGQPDSKGWQCKDQQQRTGDRKAGNMKQANSAKIVELEERSRQREASQQRQDC